MEEARKPFEYDDDKKGALLFFIIMLISADILIPILFMLQVGNVLEQNAVISISFKAISILYFLFLLFTAFTCIKPRKNFVHISKIYLIIRTVFMIGCTFILCFHNISDKSLIGKGKQYSTTTEFILWEVLFRLAYVLITSGGWYLYFLKSKKCKELTMELSNK